MSDQTVVMNISETSPYLSGFCDLKCDYSFYYNVSICFVYPNSGNTSLNFTYESNQNGTNQVLYNGIEYNVSGVFIYSPSLHYFGGNQADAEIQILHQAVLGNGSPLVVCIPITSVPNSVVPNYKGTQLVTDMINYAIPVINTTRQIENELNNEISSANTELTNLENNDMIKSGSGIANVGNKIKSGFDNLGRRIAGRPTQSTPSSIENQLSTLQDQLSNVENQVNNYLNQKQVLNVRNYTLEYLVPDKTPFFSYTNTNDNAYYIVYGIMDSAIFVDADVIQNLQSVIFPYYSNPAYIDTVVSPSTTANIYPLFLNNAGATSLMTTNLSDEIYIDCQPTGSSTQQTNITTSTDASGVQIKTSSVTFFIYVMFFILVLVVIYMIFGYITHPDKKNFSLGNMKNPFTQ